MTEILEPESADKDSRTAILEKLGELAEPHIKDSNGRLVLLPIELSDLRYHVRPDTGPLDDPEFIENTASLADNRYPAIQEQMDALAIKNGETFAFVDQILKEPKNNLVFCTNHGELADIALIFAAFCSTMAKSGYEDILKKHTRGIIISQIVDRIGIKLDPNSDPLPADQALALLCHHVWKSYPTTDSMSELRGSFREKTGVNNLKMSQSVHRALGRGGLVLAMSPSGRQDRPLQEAPDTTLLHPVKSGTMKFMKHGNTYTLFVAVDLGDENSHIEFSGQEVNGNFVAGIPQRLIEDQDVNGAMDDLSKTLGRMTGRSFMYKPAGKKSSRSRISRAINPDI